jgi:MFS family permease
VSNVTVVKKEHKQLYGSPIAHLRPFVYHRPTWMHTNRSSPATTASVDSAAHPAPASRVPLTRNQVRSFWAAWSGWTLDGMDSFIYALVLVPSLDELLPHSGITPGPATIGYYGGILFAVFLIGWGMALVWGPVADRFGRVRTLALTILCYSLFTFLGALSGNIWELAIYRFFAGVGIGGEWAIGGTLVAEDWPESRRESGAGWMHTGYYVGMFLAALANWAIGSRYGWRAMFALGGVPALLVAFIRYGVAEPERWQAKMRAVARRAARSPLAALFQPEFRRRTILNALYVTVSICGLWAGLVYVPAAVTQLAIRGGAGAAHAARLASWATMLLSAATIAGCLAMPAMARRWGRRWTLASFFACMLIFIPVAFGVVFYATHAALAWFFVCLFFLGWGGASFAVYTLWLPEQYPTECRATAFSFTTSVGRFAGAGMTFLVGAGAAYFHTIGTPVALTAIAFVVGLAVVPLGVETRGRPLPE